MSIILMMIISCILAQCPGLQKFGTFVGINDADGPFIELGFGPATIWVKRISGAENDWVVQDSERQKYNPVSEYLLLNSQSICNRT